MAQSAEQIRAAAMALMAQAEALEAEPEPQPTREDYVEWAMNAVGFIDTVEQAWNHIVDTWDELDGDETLGLLSLLIERIGAPPQQGDEDYAFEAQPEAQVIKSGPDPTVIRTFLMTQGYDPGELGRMTDAQVQLEAENLMRRAENPEPEVNQINPWPEGTAAHDRLAARLQPRQPAAAPRIEPELADGRAPRGMKRRTAPASPGSGAVRPDFEDGHGLTRGDDPELAAARAQARVRPAPVGKLKTGAPRKASGHQIPPDMQQWKRDGAGRRVPIDQEA